jgi:hypothetical protein
MKFTTSPASLFMMVFAAGIPAQAAAIDISYSFTGGPTGPPIFSGNTVTLDGFFTGSVFSGSPALNAVWNPVTYSDHSVVDLTTGLLNGTFIMTFADSDMLSGKLFEDVSAAPGGIGPFTQTFTFTGGTGQFAGATGSAMGAGIGGSTATVSGTGTLNAPAIAPEPASLALFFGGLLVSSARLASGLRTAPAARRLTSVP